MLFNSVEFLLFLPIVFLAYWAIRDRSRQNLFLIAASYFFYGWWDWRFLILIIISSLVDYILGIKISRSTGQLRRRNLLLLSLLTNLGILGIFKYYNFFIDTFQAVLGTIGMANSTSSLSIILPVGISFYTFQTLSYTIDIYRKKLEPTHDPVAFFAFVAFFPQLVAGPIERAGNLLPQFLKRRRFDRAQANDGLKQILWGFFKKLVIADNLALRVDSIFMNYGGLGSGDLLLGLIFFSFQIYCDFSGYSDIAIGTAKLFNIKLTRNFAFPYFSRDIGEFLRRWHISLSTWFRDYLFIPLGGSRTRRLRYIMNILIVFSVSGLWHGPNWTFVVWGLLNGLFYIPLIFRAGSKTTGTVAEGRLLPTGREALSMGITYFQTLVAWAFFRADTVADGLSYLGRMFSTPGQIESKNLYYFAVILAFVAVEWLSRFKIHALTFTGARRPIRWAIYGTLLLTILYFGIFHGQAFIYFQF